MSALFSRVVSSSDTVVGFPSITIHGNVDLDRRVGGHVGGDRVGDGVRQRHRAGLAALWQPEDLAVAGEQLDLPPDVDLAGLEVDVVGGEAEDLALPQSESGS